MITVLILLHVPYVLAVSAIIFIKGVINVILYFQVAPVMGSNDNEYTSEEEVWVFYRDREEWSDVTPIPQDDGPNSVVKIAYTDACKCTKSVQYLFSTMTCVSTHKFYKPVTESFSLPETKLLEEQ